MYPNQAREGVGVCRQEGIKGKRERKNPEKSQKKGRVIRGWSKQEITETREGCSVRV